MTSKLATTAPAQALLDAFLRKPSGTPLPPLVRRTAPPSLSPSKTKPRRQHRRAWLTTDIALVRTLVAAGYSNTAIADWFGRTRSAVNALLHTEGIRRSRAVLSAIRCGLRPTAEIVP